MNLEVGIDDIVPTFSTFLPLRLFTAGPACRRASLRPRTFLCLPLGSFLIYGRPGLSQHFLEFFRL